jgi:aspartate ammonia-lyase
MASHVLCCGTHGKNSTMIAKTALESGRSVYELVLEQQLLSKEELDRILAPENMVR